MMIEPERAFVSHVELKMRRRPRDDKQVMIWRGPPRIQLGEFDTGRGEELTNDRGLRP
jgi:hypothetical protein